MSTDYHEPMTEEERRREDELAEEGYRLLSDETLQFCAGALWLAHEVWEEESWPAS